MILGGSEDENLLGTVTLEIFGLILDPLKREIRPARLILKRGNTSIGVRITLPKRGTG